MKIYIPVCDQFLHLIPIIKYSMDKYWSTKLDVTIIGYKKPDFDLCGWKFCSLAEIDNGPNFWAYEMLDFFSNVDDEFFIYWNEDRPIIRPVNIKLLDILINCLDDSVGRIGLTKDIQNNIFEIYKTIDNYNIIKLKKDAIVRNSLLCSIWNREYFLSCLQMYKEHSSHMLNDSRILNAGYFERFADNNSHLYKNSNGIIYEILGSLDNFVFQLVNLYRKDHNTGKYPGNFEKNWYKDDYSNDEMYQEDRKEIMKLIKINEIR